MIKYTRLLTVFGITLSILFSSTLAQPFEVANAALELTDTQQSFGWNPQQGDWLYVNVQDNTLQLVRADYSKISQRFRVGSGKNDGKMMHYLGRTYDPATPERIWEVRSKQQQNWYNVFGSRESKEQLFLRLYEVHGEERISTAYGIHTVPNIDDLLVENDGFNSWGCILTDYQLLKFIEMIYELNGGVVRVVTNRGSISDALELVQSMGRQYGIDS